MKRRPTRRDTAEIDELYRRNAGSLYRLAVVLMWDRDAAEDVVHGVFADAVSRRDHIEKLDRPDLWLRRGVINRSSNLRRDRTRTTEKIQRVGLASVGAEIGLADSTIEFFDLAHALPAQQRQCVLLRYVDGLDIAEIARVLDVSEGTVKTSLHRGRQRLVEQLGDGLSSVDSMEENRR